MAKGTTSKTTIYNKIMETFPGSFWETEGKILRVPMEEDGEVVEIKVTLTAAKNVLGDGAGAVRDFSDSSSSTISPAAAAEPTEEEKANVHKLIQALNF